MKMNNKLDRIIGEIKKRMDDGDGFARLYMKDGRQLDIDLCADGNYRICYPPYIHEGLTKWCKNLEEVAEFIIAF